MVRMLDVARTAEAIKLRTCATHLSASFRLHCDRESCCQEAETDRTNPYRGAQAQVARQQRRSYIYLLRRTTTPLFVQRDVLRRSSHKSIEFLHHGLEQGSPFPPFSEYQDTFSNKLTPDMFAAFAKERRIERGGHRIIPTLNYVESDIKNESYICFRRRDVKAMRKTRASQASSSEKLMRLKQELATAAELMTYPYWKERRIERGGHRIIPTLNYDEPDIKNESYICFRRRDVKAMRKTRASQASSSEKLMLLKQELATAAELTSQAKAVWEKREDLASLKRKFPSLLNAKEDEELFYDKEKVVKKPKLTEPTRIVGLRLKSRDNNGDLISPTQHHDAVVRPKERAAAILAQVDREMARIKDRDHHWEDGIENAYQPQPVTHAQRHFNGSPHLSQLDRHHHCCRHLRPLLLTTNCPLQNGVPSNAIPSMLNLERPTWRFRRTVSNDGPGPEVSPSVAVDLMEAEPTTDNPHSHHHAVTSTPANSGLLAASLTSVSSLVFLQLFSRIFTFVRDYGIRDNEPSVGNDGPDEKDRALLNEFHPTYLLKGMSLKKTIIQQLTTDPTIYTPSSDGRLLGFCLIGPASPPRFVATPSLLFRVPLSLRPPSRAAAMHHHQQQSAQQGAIGTPQTTGRPFLCSSK
ncbi:hypothetical protein EDB83DRAFT_2531843 [Lactarius deliciosus]|nr:hypothetical protein EDB83DRAFT_2531843 [Lactarius deliciosus]